MYVVKVGFYVWVAGNGLLTTSLSHAHPFATHVEANGCASWVRDNYELAVAGLPETPRTLRAYYLSKRPPVEVVLRADEQAALNATAPQLTLAPDPVAAAGTAAPKPPAPRKQPATGGEPKPPGITRQVYQWCLDHPQASKADALAAWPAANPSTVGVQYSAARRAGV